MATCFKTLMVLLPALSAGLIAGAQAQTIRDAYLQDSRGAVVRSANLGDAANSNLCVRTGYWTPALAIAECDPDISPKPAKPVPKPAEPTRPMAKPAPAPTLVAGCNFVETLGSDESFDFGKSVLRPSALAKLDALAAKAAACGRISSLLITGHTDRIGSTAFNQKLSESRAAAVADHLARKGLAGARVVGAGKSLPVKACEDSLPRKALIACLAPNRRVTIEIQGTAR